MGIRVILVYLPGVFAILDSIGHFSNDNKTKTNGNTGALAGLYLVRIGIAIGIYLLWLFVLLIIPELAIGFAVENFGGSNISIIVNIILNVAMFSGCIISFITTINNDSKYNKIQPEEIDKEINEEKTEHYSISNGTFYNYDSHPIKNTHTNNHDNPDDNKNSNSSWSAMTRAVCFFCAIPVIYFLSRSIHEMTIKIQLKKTKHNINYIQSSTGIYGVLLEDVPIEDANDYSKIITIQSRTKTFREERAGKIISKKDFCERFPTDEICKTLP